MKRQCTTCGLLGRDGVPATHVATAPDKMQWYECDRHEPWEHADAMRAPSQRLRAEEMRCALQPLQDWLQMIGVDDGDEPT